MVKSDYTAYVGQMGTEMGSEHSENNQNYSCYN